MKLSKFLNWKIVLASVVFIIIISFSSIVSFFVDLQWFGEVGYQGVFYTRLFTKFKLGIPIFLVLLLLIYLYLMYLKKEYSKHSKVIYSKSQLKSVNIKLLGISAIVSVLGSAVISSSYWYDILKFINSTTFNLSDPLFNRDVSFYVFKLPLYKAAYSTVFSLLILLIIVTVIFYMFTAVSTEAFEGNRENGYNVLSMDRKSGSALGRQIIEFAGRQLAFLVSVLFLMLALGYVFKNYNLVYSPRGVAFGASYTDVNVSVLFNRFLIGLSVVAAVSVFYALFRKKLKLTLWIIGIMIGVSIIQGIWEVGVERFIVAPNAIEKEKEFISYNIKYTKYAYGLDKVEEKDFPSEDNLSVQDIEKNSATINNIRINDFKPALEAYNQLQGIRNYYRFNDVDIDRYNINGRYTQVFLAPRELDQTQLDPNSQTWLNQHLVYTHGYGITMSPVNTVTAQGQPNLIIKDIPPVSSVDLTVERPEIYFGELTNDYIITNTKTPEMNYPSGSGTENSYYEGKAGITLGGLNRLLFMVNKGSFNFLLSQDISSDSKIVMNRNIKNRVQKIAPFLMYDNDPYIVLNDGKLYWIMDAYTIDSSFPYSEPTAGINYIRNSVKVIIDAYNGTTDFYIIDEGDPLAATYSKIFPGLFKNYSDIPEGFIEHLRYPQDIFSVQMEVYKKYHMTDPRVFYNKEDMWAIPGESQSPNQEGLVPEPSYITMRLPEGKDEEFILINSYTPLNKDNMLAWMGARMDKENYGKLILYRFPKQKVTYGPNQFKTRVNQDSMISKELSLWNQQGSSVVTGTIIAIPIEKSLIYVMPIYIKSTGTSSIPEMKRVVLGYGDRIVMEETLDKALTNIFNIKKEDTTEPPDIEFPPTGENTDINNLILKANDEFLKAKEAQQNGNWAAYGEHINELENILKQLGAVSE